LLSSWRCADLATAVAAVGRLCLDRVAPASARIQAGAGFARLALAWEGLETAPIERDRAARLLVAAGLSNQPDLATNEWVREALPGHPIEVDARWSALAAWAAWPGPGELQLFGLHAGGSFAVLSLPGGESADAGAERARAAGARVLAPRRLRDAEPAWEAMGAGEAWQRLVEALSAEESP
jgi:hypothetical protein